jgi:hypothetical protein
MNACLRGKTDFLRALCAFVVSQMLRTERTTPLAKPCHSMASLDLNPASP